MVALALSPSASNSNAVVFSFFLCNLSKPTHEGLLKVDELQNTIEGEQNSLMEEIMKITAEENKIGVDDASGGLEAMAVE